MLASAKAALLEGGTTLSSKLLEDHKRENAESREDAEKRVAGAAELKVSKSRDWPMRSQRWKDASSRTAR